MSLLSILGISDAMASVVNTTGQAAHVVHPAHHQGSMVSTVFMMLAIFGVFYFLMIRPQQKRIKEQRDMLSQVAVGDEVLTGGGIAGRVVKLKDTFLTVKIAKDTEILVKKAAVSDVLRKGTLDTID